MKTLDECHKYEPEIVKVTKANSFVAGGRVIYVAKKDNTGKIVKSYVAYDKETKVKLAAHWDKDVLMGFIQQQDMSVFPRDEYSLF